VVVLVFWQHQHRRTGTFEIEEGRGEALTLWHKNVILTSNETVKKVLVFVHFDS